MNNSVNNGHEEKGTEEIDSLFVIKMKHKKRERRIMERINYMPRQSAELGLTSSLALPGNSTVAVHAMSKPAVNI
jgi:hypothetical protein